MPSKLDSENGSTMPKNLTAKEFELCLPYLSMERKNIDMAMDYLVKGFSLSSVGQTYQCTKQNVLSTANRVLKAHEKYLEAQERLKS